MRSSTAHHRHFDRLVDLLQPRLGGDLRIERPRARRTCSRRPPPRTRWRARSPPRRTRCATRPCRSRRRRRWSSSPGAAATANRGRAARAPRRRRIRAACRARCRRARTPWLASTCASNLRFWPTLRALRALQPGLEQRERRAPRRSAPARPGTGARAAGRRRRSPNAKDMPTSCAVIGSRPVVSVSKPTSAALSMRASHATSALLVGERQRTCGARLARRVAGLCAPAAPRRRPAPPRSASMVLKPKRSYSARSAFSSGLPRELVEPHRQRDVALHGEQPAALGQPVERPAQVLAHRAVDLGGVRDHRVERAVLLDPFRRGLRADLVHAGHVVHRVARQREVVDDSAPARRRTSAARPRGRASRSTWC